MTQIMCDPPSGWKYGFPKLLPKHLAGILSDKSTNDFNTFGESVMKWLVEAGYPQEEIDKCGEHFCLRYWEAEELL